MVAAKCYHPPGAHLLILSKAAFSQSQVEAKRGLPPPHGKKTREDPRGLQIGASTLPKPLGCFGTNVQPAKHHSVRHPAPGLGDLRLLCVSSFFARPFLSFPAPLESALRKLLSSPTGAPPQPSSITILPARRQTHFCLCFTILQLYSALPLFVWRELVRGGFTALGSDEGEPIHSVCQPSFHRQHTQC